MNSPNLEHFGKKFRFKNGKKHGEITPHISFRDKDFCLLGYCNLAIAFIEWDKRGGYGLEFVTVSVDDLIFQEPKESEDNNE